MSVPAYFEVNPVLRKVEPPYYPAEIMCPGRPWEVSTHMVAVAPPDFPQLAEGLEIGALYESVPSPEGGPCSHFFLSNYYFEGCEKLARLVSGGKRLAEDPCRMVDWSIRLSELVVDESKYPESEGRGPFWELLRYGLRGMTFGPVVCKKLVADFEKWYMDAWALGDLEFYDWYVFMQDCFETANGTGMVVYPETWWDGKGEHWEPKLGQETVELIDGPRKIWSWDFNDDDAI
jgi:hypothetical protein